MAWAVDWADEFGRRWAQLSETEQVSVGPCFHPLEAWGSNLGFPHSSGINGSEHGHMREIRTQHLGRPYRTLYAPDPRHNDILRVGGDRAGADRWYDLLVPPADRPYTDHLEQLRKEGLIDG